MATRNELAMVIKARDESTAIMRGIGREVASLNKTLAGMQLGAKGVQAVGDSFGGAARQIGITATAFAVAQVALGALKASFGTAKSTVIDFNASMEQSKIAFTTMLGSAQEADTFLTGLQKFAALTPFEFPDLLVASRRMLAYGFSAKQITPLLTAVGDAAAAFGGSGEMIDRITTALGQMQAKTKVSAEEMRQLTEAGIPAWKLLADAIGKTVPETMKLAEANKITSGMFIKAFQDFTALNYGGMMEKQSRTFVGAMSTIKDSVVIVSGQAFKPLFDVISAGAQKMSTFVQSADFTAWGARVSAGIQDAMSVFGLLRDRVSGLLSPLMTSVPNAFTSAFAAGRAAAANELGNLVATVNENLGLILQISTVLLGAWAAIVGITAAASALRFAGTVAVATASLVVFNATMTYSALVAGTALIAGVGSGAIGMAGMVVGAVRNIGLVLVILSTGLLGVFDVFKVLAVGARVAFLGTILPAITGTIMAALTAVAPFIIGIAAIATVIALVAVAWSNNWLGIQGVAATALKWVEDKINAFLDWLQGVPLFGGMVGLVRDSARAVVAEAPKLIAAGAGVAKAFAKQFSAGFPDMSETIRKATADAGQALDDMQADITAQLAKGERDRQMGEMARNTAAFLGGLTPPPDLPPPPDTGGGGGAGEKAKAAAVSIGDLVDAMVRLSPASQAAAASVARVRLQLVGLQDAQKSNAEATRLAQVELKNLQDRATKLGDALSTAKAKLDALSQTRLRGQGAQDEQQFQIEQQIKRLQAQALGVDTSKMMPLDAAARRFVKTLPQSIPELEKMLEIMRLTGSLKYDEQLRRIGEAAKGIPQELTFGDAISQIVNTKAEIGNLEGQLVTAQLAVTNQEAAIAALTEAGRLLSISIQDVQEQLRLEEQRQALVNEGLKIAYQWFLDDAVKMAEMGTAAVDASIGVDTATRALLSTITTFAQSEAAAANAAIQSSIDKYNELNAARKQQIYDQQKQEEDQQKQDDNKKQAQSFGTGAWLGAPTATIPASAPTAQRRSMQMFADAIANQQIVVEVDGAQLASVTRTRLLRTGRRNASVGLA